MVGAFTPWSSENATNWGFSLIFCKGLLTSTPLSMWLLFVKMILSLKKKPKQKDPKHSSSDATTACLTSFQIEIWKVLHLTVSFLRAWARCLLYPNYMPGYCLVSDIWWTVNIYCINEWNSHMKIFYFTHVLPSFGMDSRDQAIEEDENTLLKFCTKLLFTPVGRRYLANGKHKVQN